MLHILMDPLSLRTMTREVVANMHAFSVLQRAPELQARNRTLLEINNAIVTSLQREELLHTICEALRPVLPFDRAAINIYEPETDSLCSRDIKSSRCARYRAPQPPPLPQSLTKTRLRESRSHVGAQLAQAPPVNRISGPPSAARNQTRWTNRSAWQLASHLPSGETTSLGRINSD